MTTMTSFTTFRFARDWKKKKPIYFFFICTTIIFIIIMRNSMNGMSFSVNLLRWFSSSFSWRCRAVELQDNHCVAEHHQQTLLCSLLPFIFPWWRFRWYSLSICIVKRMLVFEGAQMHFCWQYILVKVPRHANRPILSSLWRKMLSSGKTMDLTSNLFHPSISNIQFDLFLKTKIFLHFVRIISPGSRNMTMLTRE